MKKRKILFVILCINIILISSNFIFTNKAKANEISVENFNIISNKPIITLDEIIKAAIDNSENIKLKSKEIKLYNDKLDVQDKTNDFYESISQKIYDFSEDKLELQEKQVKQSKEFLKDQIANDITNKYNSIITKQMDIDKAKTNLEIKNKELNTIQTKVNIGMATENQLNDKKIEIKSLSDDLEAKNNSLKNNIDYLGVLTNLNLQNYSLDNKLEYNKFVINGSVDEYIDDKIEKYLKYNDEMIKLTKDYLDDLKDDGIKDILTSPIPEIPKQTDFITVDENNVTNFDSGKYAIALIGYIQNEQIFIKKLDAYNNYIDGKYNLEESKIKLDDSKKTLKNALKEGYSTLTDLENKIENLNEQIKSTNTKLKFAKTQMDIGMVTENTYKAQVLKSKDLDTALINLINTYNTLQNTIQKPWILSK